MFFLNILYKQDKMFDKDLKSPYQPPNEKVVGDKEIEEIAKKEIYFFTEYKVFF